MRAIATISVYCCDRRLQIKKELKHRFDNGKESILYQLHGAKCSKCKKEFSKTLTDVV